jgi:hypothetical protein
MAARPRSSFLSSRLRGRTTLVLWIVAALFASALTAALLLQRGERDDVSAYIQDVSDTQRSFALELGNINRAYEQFQLSPAAVAAQLPRLREAARTMTSLRTRVEQIRAPAQAAELRRRVIAYFRQQERVAWELVTVTAFLPELVAAEKPLTAANAALRKGLQGAGSAPEQAAALRQYARKLEAVAASLRATDAPPLLAPAQRERSRQIDVYASSSRRLASAVASGDRTAFDAANAQLATASSRPSAVLRAQQAAITAYNKRVSRIKELAVAVEQERQRLDRELG